MDYTMMYPAGRLIEQSTREQLRLDWEDNRAGMDLLVERRQRFAARFGRAVAHLKSILATGKQRKAHA